MPNWDLYAQSHPHTEDAYTQEPVQLDRVTCIADRCVGTVLDVGSSDGYAATLYRNAGHDVHVVDVSETRVLRAAANYHLDGTVADATQLPFSDASWDTVVLGEILEHLGNPGPALSEACRVARERVVVSVPLRGWCDPTHQWRISLDYFNTPIDETRGEQIVLTWQRGTCWPMSYFERDPSWKEQFNGEAQQERPVGARR